MGGFREDRFDVSISEGCGVSLLASNIRGISSENQGWRQWNLWFGSVSITDVLLVRDYICSSVWGLSINNSGMIAINTTGPVDFRSVETQCLTGPDRASEALKGKIVVHLVELGFLPPCERQIHILLFLLTVYSKRVKVLIREDRPIWMLLSHFTVSLSFKDQTSYKWH